MGGVGAQALGSEPVVARRPPWAAYARRQPEKTLLHKVVRENLETFLAEVRASNPEGRGLPGHVEQEFRRYLKCGILEEGWAHTD